MINLLKELLRLNKRVVSEHFAAVKLKDNTLKKIATITAQGNEINLEIGAGEKKGKNGWITLDMYAGCDIQWDLRNGIPFADNSISKIYSSHLFEHLTFKETAGLMKECLRVLKPEGQFLICVPNSRLYIEAYSKNDNTFWSLQDRFKPAFNNTTKMDIVNYIAYMDGHHKYMFDEENLLAVLEKHGFKNAKLRSFNPELDLKERDHESIYAEAVK
jgi:predicted SAM-dependent methyltransferase